MIPSISNARRDARSPGALPIPPGARGAYSSVIDLAGASRGVRGNMGALKFDGGVDGHALLLRSLTDAGRLKTRKGSKTGNIAVIASSGSPSRYQARPVEANDRGERFLADLTTGRSDSRVAAFSSRDPLNLMRGLLVSLYPPGELPEGLRSFSFPASVLQHSPGRMSEFQQIKVSVVRDQFTTRSANVLSSVS